MQGVKLLRAGRLTQKEIAERLGVSRGSVSNGKRQLEAEGRKGLKARRSSGRPAKLSRKQQQDILLRVIIAPDKKIAKCKSPAKKQKVAEVRFLPRRNKDFFWVSVFFALNRINMEK